MAKVSRRGFFGRAVAGFAAALGLRAAHRSFGDILLHGTHAEILEAYRLRQEAAAVKLPRPRLTYNMLRVPSWSNRETLVYLDVPKPKVSA